MVSKLYPGLVIDNVELQELLREGGQAEIWSVRNIRYPEHSNLVLKAFVTTFDERNHRDALRIKARLEEERKLLGQHRHRFIVTVHDVVGDTPDLGGIRHEVQGLVMDRASEGGLGDFIASARSSYRRMPPIEKLLFIGRMAEGLKAIHGFHIVHNDIKPDNILVHDDGGMLIPAYSDFGMSFKIGAAAVVGGTPNYMAPEVRFDKTKSPDLKADIFSFGVVCYEFITGEHPLAKFSNTSDREMLEIFRKRLEADEFIPQFDGQSPIDSELYELVKSMCAEDPRSRPNIGHVREQLKKLEDSAGRSSAGKSEDDFSPSFRGRYVWSDRVHELLGEKELFCFVQGRRLDKDCEYLEEKLRAKGVFGFSLLKLVGANDYLLRMWLSPTGAAHVKAVLDDYNQQRFGGYTVFEPAIKVTDLVKQNIDLPPLVSRRDVLERILVLSEDAAGRDEQFDKLLREGTVVARTKKDRESILPQRTPKKIRIVALVKGQPQRLIMARAFAKELLVLLRESTPTISELEVFVGNVTNGQTSEYLVTCELDHLHSYKSALITMVNSFSGIDKDFIGEFRTHFEMDAEPYLESQDGRLLHEASKIR